MSLELVPVKEEEVEDGFSEAAVELYGDHEIKNELVVGPEILQRVLTYEGRACSSDDMKISVKSESEDQSYVKTEPLEIEAEPESHDEKLMGQTGRFNKAVEVFSTEGGLVKSSDKLPQTHEKTQLQCLICEGRFNSVSNYTTHMNSHLASPGEESSSHACDICTMSFKLKWELIKHMRHHTHLASPCTSCKKHFTCTYMFLRDRTDANKFSLFCNICEQIIDADDELFYHDKAIDQYRCKLCEEPFLRIDITTGYKCDMCNMLFASDLSLENHNRNHKGPERFSCEMCEKRFSSSGSLSRHVIVHAKRRFHSCDICNKRFSTKYSLANHKMRHSPKRYSCKVCNKQFRRKDFFTQHELNHLSETVFSCRVCGKCFRRKDRATAHEAAHAAKRCEICNEEFDRKIGLKIHLQKLKIKGQEHFSCKICKTHYCYKPHHSNAERITDGNSVACEISESSEASTFTANNASESEEHCAQKVVKTYRRVQKGAMFSCIVCKKQFSKQSSLTQHTQLLHS